MNWFFNDILISFVNWGPYIFGLAVFFVVAAKRLDWFGYFSKIGYKTLIWVVLAFKSLYALVETLSQYYVWKSNEFTSLFLDQRAIPLDFLKNFSGKFYWLFNNKFGYLIFYSWGRFWMQIVVALGIAGAFYLFLLFLKKYKERFFEEGEVELGFILAFLVGWPNFIIFLPLTLVSVVFVSIVRVIFFKEFYTTLGVPLIVSALIVLLFGNYFINFLGLVAFRV